MEPLTPEQILDVFRQLGLEREEERGHFVLLSQPDPSATSNASAQVFIRADSRSQSPEDSDAQLA